MGGLGFDVSRDKRYGLGEQPIKRGGVTNSLGDKSMTSQQEIKSLRNKDVLHID